MGILWNDLLKKVFFLPVFKIRAHDEFPSPISDLESVSGYTKIFDFHVHSESVTILAYSDAVPFLVIHRRPWLSCESDKL